MTRPLCIAGLTATALAGAVYAAMLLWTLPRLTVDGLCPFDMRPFGYGFEEARAYLAALGPEGAAFYRDAQQALDTAFPPLRLAMMVFLLLLAAGWCGRVGPRVPRAAVVLLLAAAVAGPVLDLVENHAVAAMLAAGPAGVSADMVARASALTVAKSAADMIAYAGLAAIVLTALTALALRLLRRHP